MQTVLIEDPHSPGEPRLINFSDFREGEHNLFGEVANGSQPVERSQTEGDRQEIKSPRQPPPKKPNA